MLRFWKLFCFNFLSIFFFSSFFCYCFLSLFWYQKKTKGRKRSCFSFSLCRHVGEYVSLGLFYSRTVLHVDISTYSVQIMPFKVTKVVQNPFLLIQYLIAKILCDNLIWNHFNFISCIYCVLKQAFQSVLTANLVPHLLQQFGLFPIQYIIFSIS